MRIGQPKVRHVCRQKIGENQAQATSVVQHSAETDGGEDSLKPVLETHDAQYLRKRKAHMDAMFDTAADS